MKLLVATLFLASALNAQAGEYRFECFGAVTGLCDHVYEKNGKETTVKLHFADPESAEIFLALQQKRIYGTKGFKDHMGVRWEQGIYLVGEFASGIKRTPEGPNMAGSESYRDFKVIGIKLVFPVWRFQESLPDNPPDSMPYMETHFSFRTLFPQGLQIKGKQIDFGKHTIDHTRKGR
ncbi:MAG: hypothetical protein V4710_02480 [Verrucomicrobiota bacterium]